MDVTEITDEQVKAILESMDTSAHTTVTVPRSN